MLVCKTCKRQDVDEINKLLTDGKESVRNIVAKFKGTSLGGINRHKGCITELFAEVREQKRAGLLADIDEVKEEIDAVKAEFSDNGQVRVQLIARRLDAIEKEAKLTGAYTKDRANPTDIAELARIVTQNLIDAGWPKEEAEIAVAKRYNLTELTSNAVH